MQILAGSQNLFLAEKLAKITKQEVIFSQHGQYSGGESKISLSGKLTDQQLFIIQSVSHPVNDSLMELLILANAAQNSSIDQITAIVPYLGYARQNKPCPDNPAIPAEMIAKMLALSGINRLITLDLHSDDIIKSLSMPVTNISLAHIFADIPKTYQAVVAPDAGAMERCQRLAIQHESELLLMEKQRDARNLCSITGVVGNPMGKNCLIGDDIVDSAGTLCQAAHQLKEMGAKKIDACVTHAILSGEAVERINKSPIDKIYISNTINHPKLSDKFHVVDISGLISNIILD